MLEVGLTGGIACGKSVVLSRFETHGVPTLDADAVVHRLLATPSDVTAAIVRRFGDEVQKPDGSIDRAPLGAIVFRDAEARAALESILHPEVWTAIDAFFARARESGARVAVVDAALMFETGSSERYDRIVVAYCPKETQLMRLMARDGSTREQAERRIAAQLPVEEKRRRADFVVDTSGTMAETLERADDVLSRLEAAASDGDG